MSVYHIEQNLNFKTFDQLVTELSELVSERNASSAQLQQAMRRAISETENYTAWSVTYSVSIDSSLCLQAMPCCGIRNFRYQSRISNCHGQGCYRDTNAWLEHGQLRIPPSAVGDGLLTVYGFNEVTATQETITNADVVGDEYWIYLKGQPEIPPFGFIQICGETFFYRCKSGYEWTQIDGVTEDEYTWMIDSEVGVSSEPDVPYPDFTGLGKYRPRGAHTVLYAVPVDNCGRIQQVNPELTFPGTDVVFPVVYSAQAYTNLLISTAASSLYLSMINSCSSAKDTERYKSMREFYQQDQQRLIAKVPRTKKPRIVTRNDFTADTLRTEWPTVSPRGIPYQRCCR